MPHQPKPILVEIAQQTSQTRPPLWDWMDTHRKVLGLWLDELIAKGDPDDLVSMIHRQQSWLAMMQDRVSNRAT